MDKPRFRGRLHQGAFVASIPLGLVLLLAAESAASRVAASVYAASLSALYGTSAAYHRLAWSPRALRWIRSLDHSMIFVLIAGSYTPFALLVLQGWIAAAVLAGVWAGAILGMVIKVAAISRLRVVGSALYIVLGWVVVVAGPQLVRRLSAPSIALLAVGGILYTGGSVVLLRRKPDPSPAVFGYHEIWHSCVVTASACHYIAILLVVLAAR